MIPSLCQELPGDLGRYGRRWIISIPADSCLEGRVGLCPRVLVSADASQYASEFLATNVTSDDLSEELRSEGDEVTGTGAALTASRWIEGWRGFEQQVGCDDFQGVNLHSWHRCTDSSTSMGIDTPPA